jgi:thiamine-phosphate pyrophosphorylase
LSPSLPSPRLCLITDETRSPAENLRTIDIALEAGCRWVQLRHRSLGGRALLAFARQLRRLTAAHSATLIVNDRVDVALASGADGVHLPSVGMAPAAARLALGPQALLGASIHSVDEVSRLAAEPLDYLQFGPVFDTASKRAFGPPQGLDALAAATAASGPRPVCAVGGLRGERAASVSRLGAAAIAVIGAVHAADNPASAVRALLVGIRQP